MLYALISNIPLKNVKPNKLVMYMYVVYIWKWSSAHALGGVSGVASFITTDERLQ